jgi:hypothetical protein
MVSIQEDVPYVMLNSLIRVGMAGVSIVSAYITIVAMELRIASIFHAS